MSGLGEKTNVYVKELPVSYVTIHQIIIGIWKTLKPKQHKETVGRKKNSQENQGHCCIEGGAEKLDSVVNLKIISKHFQQEEKDVIYSRDADRYLCAFAYCCSLHHGGRRAAFVHIPSKGHLSSLDRLVPLLQEIILKMLQQLEETDPQTQQLCSMEED